MSKKVPLYIDGEFVASKSEQWIPSPIQRHRKLSPKRPLPLKVKWKQRLRARAKRLKPERSTIRRARVMMRYQALLKEHQEEIAEILAQETGKTFEDAKGDVWRGIEVVEHAANIPSLLMGETVENVARKIDSPGYTQPLGVCAGITPFNFPAMIPLWMFPLAIACGNTFILSRLSKILNTNVWLNCLKKRVLQRAFCRSYMVIKSKSTSCLITPMSVHCHLLVQYLFGYIYRRGTENDARTSLCRCENHCVIMPDANKQQVINNLVGCRLAPPVSVVWSVCLLALRNSSG